MEKLASAEKALARFESILSDPVQDEKTRDASIQRLESVEAVLVNWARAESYPTLAAANPDGYLHPLTFSIYRVIGQDLFLLAEETREFLIPWRPATLDDGGEYLFGGTTLRARFDFLE